MNERRKQLKGKNERGILIGQPVNLIPLDRAKGAVRSSDKSLRVENSTLMIRNLPATQETPAITTPRLHELALADAMRTQARTKKTALTTRTEILNSINWGLTNRLERRTVFTA